MAIRISDAQRAQPSFFAGAEIDLVGPHIKNPAASAVPFPRVSTRPSSTCPRPTGLDRLAALLKWVLPLAKGFGGFSSVIDCLRGPKARGNHPQL